MNVVLGLSFLQNLVVLLFILVCAAIILIVLLQKGRGGGIGAAFGGGGAGSLLGTKTGDFSNMGHHLSGSGSFWCLAVLMGKFHETGRFHPTCRCGHCTGDNRSPHAGCGFGD